MRLLAAMEDGVVIISGDGDHFDARVDLTGRAPQSLASDPHRPGRLYCGTFGHGLWISDDAGASWQAMTGLGQQQVTAVAVSPVVTGNGFGTIYAGTEPSAVFRSSDGGSTWHECHGLTALPSAATWSFPPRPHTHHVRWIAPDATMPERLFVAVEAGALVRSLDGGASWQDRAPDGPYDTHTLVTTSEVPDHLYVAAGDGYFESDDAGGTWRQPQAGLEHRYLWSVAVDPREPGLVIVSAARSARSAHSARHAESYLYRRTGGGAWSVVGDSLPAPEGTTISTVAADTIVSGVFYAASNHGIYRSRDQGLSWERLAVSWPQRFQTQRAAGLLVLHES
jgi:photosystem II stability/assembly factor-like uncharacterized protein